MNTSAKTIDPKKVKMIWLAMIASIIIYTGFGYVYMTRIPHQQSILTHDVLAKLRLALYLFSLVLLFASIKLSRKAHRSIRPSPDRKVFLNTQGIPHDPFTPSTSPYTSGNLASGYPLLVISWALTETIAIFGLVLTFVGGKAPDLFGFSLAAFFLMIINRPKIPEGVSSSFSSIEPS